jgi:hypothetical protein
MKQPVYFFLRLPPALLELAPSLPFLALISLRYANVATRPVILFYRLSTAAASSNVLSASSSPPTAAASASSAR